MTERYRADIARALVWCATRMDWIVRVGRGEATGAIQDETGACYEAASDAALFILTNRKRLEVPHG